MAASRISIITSGQLCRNPRVLKEAMTLGHAGYDVTVLTIANIERFEAYDREILRTAPFRKIAVDHVSRDFSGRFRHLASRGETWLARHASRLGWQTSAALGPALPLGRLARQHPADLAIVHTEIAFCVGRDLIAQGRRVAADFEDWHTRDLLPNAQTDRPLRLLSRVEADLMRHSAYTSTTSHALAENLQAAYGGAKPTVITNSFPLQPLEAPRTKDRPPAFFWFSQTIGPGRGLEEFLAAWSLTLRPSRVCLLGDVSSEYWIHLLSLLPVEKRPALECLPIVSPDDLPGVIARHDIGLALELDQPASRNLTITNKILQYLNAGLAVLATGTAGQREVLAAAPDVGWLVDLADVQGLAARLDALLADPTRLAEMGRAARRAAETMYCWEKNSPILLDSVARALRSPALAA